MTSLIFVSITQIQRSISTERYALLNEIDFETNQQGLLRFTLHAKEFSFLKSANGAYSNLKTLKVGSV